MSELCWCQDWRKAWSLCNSSRSHSSASGERAQKKWNPTCPEKPSVTGGMKPGWTGSRHARTSPCNSGQAQPVLPALLFPNLASQLAPSTTTSTRVLRDTATSPGDHHFHQLSGFPRPLFCFTMNAIYGMSQQHYPSVRDTRMEGKPTATHKPVRQMKPPSLEVTPMNWRESEHAVKLWRAQAPYFSQWPTQLTRGIFFLTRNFSPKPTKAINVVPNLVVFTFRALLGSFLLSS